VQRKNAKMQSQIESFLVRKKELETEKADVLTIRHSKYQNLSFSCLYEKFQQKKKNLVFFITTAMSKYKNLTKCFFGKNFLIAFDGGREIQGFFTVYCL
jgi:hypothetical protein